MGLTSNIKDKDWVSVRQGLAKLGSIKLGPTSTPTYAGLTLTGLTASRLVWTNASKTLASKDLVDLVAGTANEINITDDGDGSITIGIVNPLIVAKGGIGTASLTDHGLLVGSGTAAVTALGVAANGKIPIGSAGADPVLAEITGTANQITSTPGAGSITLSLPQDIHTGASPTFAGATIDSIVFGDVYDAQEEPTGFVDRTATLSWNDGTQTLTITGSHDIYIYGVKTTKGTDSIQITNATDLYWIYYNASGTLVASTTHPGWALPIMATVYWNTTVGFDKGLAGDERHGLVMDWQTHEYLHNTVGSRYESGLAGTFDNTTLSIATGEWHDEDIEHTLVSPETTCNVLYKNGSAAWEWDAGTSVYYKLNGTALRYNNGNNLADCTPNRYMAMWIFATNDISTPIVALMGQRQDTTLKNAQANNTYESLSFGELPFWEMKILYRVILRSTGSPPTYIETLDLRAVSNLPAGTYIATDHAVLTGLTNDDHTQYLLADGTRALAGAWDMGNQALTNVNIDSGVITGITDLAIGDGGTGQSTAQTAIDALSAVSGATNEHVLTKDTGTGNAKWKAAAGGVSTWIALTDTDPANYTGDAGRFVRVNAGEDGLEFHTLSNAVSGFDSQCSVYLGSDQVLATDTLTLVQFDTEDYDNNSEFNVGTYTWTAADTGYYRVHANLTWKGNAVDEKVHGALIYIDGSEEARHFDQFAAAAFASISITREFYLTAGQTVTIYGYQATLGNYSLDGRTSRTYMSVSRFDVGDAFTVKVDSAATAGFIGAASNDGVLRTGAGLDYTDGGNFVTLAVAVNGLAEIGAALVDADTFIVDDGDSGTTKKCLMSRLSTYIGAGTDEKVKIDAAATAGYIGAASSDGVLRTGAGITYTDGGDFVTLVVAGTYVDRGDPAGYDFQVGNFTTDGTPYSLDLSGIVPAGAKAVSITVIINDNAVDNNISFYENGNSNLFNRSLLIMQVANQKISYNLTVSCDANRVIGYLASNTTFARIDFVVCGWWI